MTRQDAKKFYPIIKAYSEGKAVQFNRMPGGWNDIDNPDFGGYVESYRIKPEPKYVPFTFEDRELLKGRWVTLIGGFALIIGVTHYGAYTLDGEISFDRLLTSYTFDDGSRCGKVVEE